MGYELIKTHPRVPKGQRSTDWNDFPPKSAAFFRRTPDWCRKQAEQIGEQVSQAVAALLEDHALHHLRQVHGILRLGEKYGPQRLNAACLRALNLGPVGVGKTHLLLAIGHQACRLGHSVLYLKTSRLLADLGGGHADGTWESCFRRYPKPELLLLHDFAMKHFTVQQAEDIYDLTDDRSRMGSVMVASNRSPQDWYPLFPNPVLAEGILNRLINKAHHVIINGKSYRPRLRPDRAQSHQVEPPPTESPHRDPTSMRELSRSVEGLWLRLRPSTDPQRR